MTKLPDGVMTVFYIPTDIIDAVGCVSNVFDQALATGRHAVGDWRLLDWEGNFEAFSEHIAEFVKNSDITTVDGEDHLANAACRLLLLLQLREEALAARRAQRPSQT